MADSACPYCREAIKSDASLCKHCHSWLGSGRERMVMSAFSGLSAALNAQGTAKASWIPSGSVSDHTAWCIFIHRGDKVGLQRCLDEAKEAASIKAVAEKLYVELMKNLFEVVWESGHIDPLPLEKAVRQRFASGK